MTTAIGNILRQSYRLLNEKLNILTFPTHERYESFIARTGHNFYGWRRTNRSKAWNTKYAPLPKNYSILYGETLPIDLDFDCVFTLAKHQYQEANRIASIFHLPLICLEVFVPNKGTAKHILQECRQFMRGDINVFINQYSRHVWGWDNDPDAVVIDHGIDTEYFCPPADNDERIPHILSVVNDWANRDWSHGFSLWRYITKDLPVQPLGDTPGLSTAVEIDALREAYQKARIYINTTLEIPVPTALLEAMSCGCAIVSTNTGGINEFIVHGENGLLSNDKDELRKHLQLLLNNPELASRLGRAARDTVLEKFNLDRFVLDWNKVFLEAANTVYTGRHNES